MIHAGRDLHSCSRQICSPRLSPAYIIARLITIKNGWITVGLFKVDQENGRKLLHALSISLAPQSSHRYGGPTEKRLPDVGDTNMALAL